MSRTEGEINYPSRIDLARTPTPMEPLKRLSEKLGVEIYVKRDDLTGMELSGNKVRKLEFVLSEALAQGADTVITCGGEQSNHARATAVTAAKLGLRSRLILSTPDPSNPPPLEGNILLDRLVGAEIVWVSPDEFLRWDELLEREVEALKRVNRKPYPIPVGASNPLGAWGYIRAVEELTHDLEALAGDDDIPTTIIHALGSGGTSAGLLLGVRLHGLKTRVVGVSVGGNRDYFIKVIGRICEKAISAYQLNLTFSPERDIEILDGYVGRGYARSRPEELALIRDVARMEGIMLDPVYT
ncbi:MAG: D-cysteine desulfhydrase family protein, partial [Deltaproteobacteria bacterium]|nr:D-cysteine desulfhydrase family protein [Deltaproteobacteria bacterium]